MVTVGTHGSPLYKIAVNRTGNGGLPVLRHMRSAVNGRNVTCLEIFDSMTYQFETIHINLFDINEDEVKTESN